MKREGAKTIAELLVDFIQEEGLTDGLERVKIFKIWDIVVGTKYANATLYKFYKNGTLYCTISSSMLRSQLYLNKLQIIRDINKMIGRDCVKELVLK